MVALLGPVVVVILSARLKLEEYWRKDTQFGQKNVSIYISGRFVDYAKAEGHEKWVVAYLAHMLLEISGLRHRTAVEMEIEIAGKNRQGDGDRRKERLGAHVDEAG